MQRVTSLSAQCHQSIIYIESVYICVCVCILEHNLYREYKKEWTFQGCILNLSKRRVSRGIRTETSDDFIHLPHREDKEELALACSPTRTCCSSDPDVLSPQKQNHPLLVQLSNMPLLVTATWFLQSFQVLGREACQVPLHEPCLTCLQFCLTSFSSFLLLTRCQWLNCISTILLCYHSSFRQQ